MKLSRDARGVMVIASKARSGPIPRSRGAGEWWDLTSPKHFRGRAISPKAPRRQTRTALEMGPYPEGPWAASGGQKPTPWNRACAR